ncbi:NAD(P)H-hydrate dehydratase [Escherichia coli]
MRQTSGTTLWRLAVLKGAGTWSPPIRALGIYRCRNAGMASGGMGDVLSGIIGALLGQKLSPYDAACAGCVAHGAAADDWRRVLERAGCWQPISFPRYSVLLTRK